MWIFFHTVGRLRVQNIIGSSKKHNSILVEVVQTYATQVVFDIHGADDQVGVILERDWTGVTLGDWSGEGDLSVDGSFLTLRFVITFVHALRKMEERKMHRL